jgi:hypothetical protein
MALDASLINNAYNSEILADQQTQIRKKHRNLLNQIKAKDTEGSNNLHTNPDKVKKTAELTQASGNTINQLYKPLFKWEKDNDNKKFHIIPSEKSITYNSLYSMENSSNHMLSMLGYKIDVSQQVDQFKQKLQKFFIESKSHNPLIGKFSELKFGIVSALLSLLGVEPNTIDTLKKEALKKAIQDNIDNFSQNEYNIELLTIFRKNKKDTGRMKILKKLRNQLAKQMGLLGQEGYYSKSVINTIKKDQVNKIFGDLLEEKQNLIYIRSFQ